MNKLLSGESISAEEAKRIGLIDELAEGHDILLEVCSVIATKSKKRIHHNGKTRGKRLLYYLPDQFVVYRSSQLFNLIRDYPESLPVLEELRTALNITCHYDYAITSIRHQLHDRLLIPGAHTEDVLQMYLRTHKVTSFLFRDSGLRIVDVFIKVATSVIDHLQRRADSVKCIVSTLLDDESMESMSENEEGDVNLDDSSIEGMLRWSPDGLQSGSADSTTMSLLIGVYGGKESFLSEYRDMLASRLVALGSFDIDREIASLNMMRSKFLSSSEALTQCSVMIKDILESRKLFLKIRAKMGNVAQLSMIVKSAHFWPITEDPIGELMAGQFEYLPEHIRDQMTAHERTFTELKPTQKIQWCKNEGIVSFSVEIKGKETHFRLSPLYIHVLSLFQSSISLSVEEVARQAGEPTEKIKSVIQFWISRNILRETEINKYVINE
jgi:anaphase-promoting complex subunit 2